MLNTLTDAEKILHDLLNDSHLWSGLYVDYHHPYVERLWTQWGENRISLHKIYPCKRNESLFHPHPWPQAVRILKGGYEMGVGYSKNHEEIPPIASTLFLPENSRYEMIDPDGWHYVRPIDSASFSIMVTGKPWQRKAENQEKLQLRSLTDKEKDDLLNAFRLFY